MITEEIIQTLLEKEKFQALKIYIRQKEFIVYKDNKPKIEKGNIIINRNKIYEIIPINNITYLALVSDL